MRVKLLAKRYAVAVFDLALELMLETKVEKDMHLVGEVLEENRLLRKVLANPVIEGSKKAKILADIFEGKIEKLTLKFLVLITKKGREVYLEDICEAYIDVFKEHFNIMPVLLTTAYKADEATKQEILEKLARIAGKSLEVSEKVNENLIGGFTLNFMDFNYDASIKTQLKELKKEFSKNLYVKKF